MRTLDVVLQHGGVVPTSRYRSLRTSIQRLVSGGELIGALPGIVMDAGLVEDRQAWLRAVHLWKPQAVIAGRAAAALTFAPELAVEHIHVHVDTHLADRGPLRFRRSTIPAHLLSRRGELWLTTPEGSCLTAGMEGDLTPGVTALRKGMIDVVGLRAAASAWGCWDSDGLMRVVRDLSGNPWSEAEVDAHRLFRAAGILGWVGNHHVVVEGRDRFIDIAIPESMTGFEINSVEFHGSQEAIQRDAGRNNGLVKLGWRMYTLFPYQLTRHSEETAEFVRSVVWRRHGGRLGR